MAQLPASLLGCIQACRRADNSDGKDSVPDAQFRVGR